MNAKIIPGSPPTFIHHLAVVETSKIGCGTRIWAWAHLQQDVVVGDYCNIAEHCFLENGVRVGNRVVIKNGISIWEGIKIADQVFLGPHVVFTNERFPRSGFPKPYSATRIEQGASLGAGAVIAPGLKIGCYATIGAGSVVTRDVVEHSLVFGNPARFQGWMCVCGLRLNLPKDKPLVVCECGRKYKISKGKCQSIEA